LIASPAIDRLVVGRVGLSVSQSINLTLLSTKRKF